MTHKQAIMCLTFIGGFVDSAGYVMLYELFTASITGNIIAATIPIYRNEPGFAARALVVMGIGLGAWCVTMYSMKLRFTTSLTKWQIGLRLFLCELAAIIVTMLVGVSLNYPTIDSPTVFVTATLMSFSMGVQNGAAMVLIPNCPPTTAMTGNTVRFFIYGAEAFNFWLAAHHYVDLYPADTGKPADYDAKMQKHARELALKFRIFLSSLGPFTIGAILGVPLAYKMGFACLIFPILVVTWVLYCIREGDRTNREESLTLSKGAGMKQLEMASSPMYAAVGDAEAGNIARQQEREQEKAAADEAARGDSPEQSYCLVEDCYSTDEITNDEVNRVS